PGAGASALKKTGSTISFSDPAMSAPVMWQQMRLSRAFAALSLPCFRALSAAITHTLKSTATGCAVPTKAGTMAWYGTPKKPKSCCAMTILKLKV
ncbi:hypothetical protein FXB71_10550, partial [Aggregatibacter actinomycetemcomitans]